MRRRLLSVAVFFAGMTTLAIELSASRLLGNVFGTSNIVWANIIGLILVYLTAGYFLGGRLADRSPHAQTFYRLMAWGAFTSGLVPLLAKPVLWHAARAVEQLSAAVMVGSFFTVLVLFSVPVTLLGCISPFAIRLAIRETDHAGRISGKMYAISTLGSILGTFLPVLLFIPIIGTALTFLVFSVVLLLVALVGLGFEDRKAAIRYALLPILLILLTLLFALGPIKDSKDQVYEVESAYNYIQVLERDGVRYLMLNEGQGIHSVYAPGQEITYGTWDYFLSAPFFNRPPVELGDVERLGIVGLAAGTIAKQYTRVFGPIPIDGWEIDPEIVVVGREWFDMTEPNLHALVADGRWGLAHSQFQYSVIGVDAYRLPYIPWHLTTKEFFQEVHDHLMEDGVVVINVGRTPDDRRLIEAMVGTIQSVFASVHVVDVPNTFNTLVYGTVQPTRPENLVANELALESAGDSPVLVDVLHRTIANLQQTPDSDIVFTDDRAPVELLTNSMVIRFVMGGNLSILR
ncbi:MAG: spermine synthase [Anaerolineales bacterium]|nr:spermine synthase [Anaerolineales bacterium]